MSTPYLLKRFSIDFMRGESLQRGERIKRWEKGSKADLLSLCSQASFSIPRLVLHSEGQGVRAESVSSGGARHPVVPGRLLPPGAAREHAATRTHRSRHEVPRAGAVLRRSCEGMGVYR